MDDWGWLLVVLGVGVVIGLGVSTYLRSTATVQAPQCSGTCPLSGSKTILQNEDVYEWVDWTGKERKIVRHRKVKLGE